MSRIKGKGNNNEVNNNGDRRKYTLLIAVFVISVLVVITYRGSINNEFVDWDDFTYVVNNDMVRNPGDTYLEDLFTRPVASNYHPLTMLSLRLNNNICSSCANEISPKPFIKGNIILHLFNSILVLILVFLLTKKNILTSFLVSAIFAVHPMHVESVAWISERKDVLYSFFFLAGLIAYVLFKQDRQKKYSLLAASFLLFIFSCLSKGMAVVFPVVLLLIDFWMNSSEGKYNIRESLQSIFSVRNLLLLLPFFLVSLFIGILTFRLQNGENFLGILDLSKNIPDVVNEIGPFSIWQRFQIAGFGFVSYLIKFIFPFNLSALYPYPTTQEFLAGPFQAKLFISIAVVIILLALVILSMRKSKIYAFGAGFYLITVALVLQFITVGMAIMADRYTYLPYIGVAFIPAYLIAESKGMARNILQIAAILFIVSMMAVSLQRIKIWNNTEILWTNVIEKYPDVELPRRSRAKLYSKKALETSDIKLKKILEEKALTDFSVAIKTGTNSPDVYEGAGVIYSSRGEHQKALEYLNKAVEMDPEKGSIYYNRALALTGLNRKEEAISDYTTALMYRPEKAREIITNRSNLLLESGRFREAARDLDYLISGDRNNFLFYYNRAYSKEQMFDFLGAIEDYQRALQLQPGDRITRERLRNLTGK